MTRRRPGAPGIILLLFLIAALAGTLWTRRPPPQLVGWREDLTAARAEAQSSAKPLLLYFTADWCGPCQQMRRSTWPDPRVNQALERYVYVRIDVDDQPAVAQRFGVDAIPRMIVLDADGRVAASRVGLVSAPDMVQWLNERAP